MARQRKFSRYEMVLELGRGVTPRQLAERYGVTAGAIYAARRSLDPQWIARHREFHNAWQREHKRALCKGGCGALIWTINQRRSGFCRDCTPLNRATGVGPDELQCKGCEQWFPDDAFPGNARAVARRGRGTLCTPCGAAARQNYRVRHKVPCEVCERPCLPPSEKGRRRVERALCLDCYRSGKRPQ